jgi:GT2 family glycosyltransferase/glycosyltransferase involved in cell wall biosynthesis/predicted  nucleic acid-binding Zn-ribbon protein
VNILFVNYGDFTTNSLNHIGGFANTLCAVGHACVVVVPHRKETLAHIPQPLFIAATYDEALARPNLFPNGQPADVIHAWTPREGVRKFTIAYQRAVLSGTGFQPVSSKTQRQDAAATPRLLIHLEDNEHFLLETYTGKSFAALRDASPAELEALLNDSLPHPVRHESFLRVADAVTHIIPKLAEFAPVGTPTHLLFPGVDFALYHPQPADQAFRRELGLGGDAAPSPRSVESRDGGVAASNSGRRERVIAFTGSNTFANEPEMRELYLAVALLNQRGTATRLVRTGFNSPRFLDGLSDEVKRHVLDLGFIEKAKLPKLLALADVLVQPGRAGAFNDYRLPSKLPEFLASGKAVAMPPTNLAALMEDGREAVFLPTGSPQEIADTCERLFADPALCAKLGENAVAFARAHFDLGKNTLALADFYTATIERPSATNWSLAADPTTSDASVFAAKFASNIGRAAATLSDPGAQHLATETDLLAYVVHDLEQSIELAARHRIAAVETERDAIAAREKLTQNHVNNIESLLTAAREHAAGLEQARDMTQVYADNMAKELARHKQRREQADVLLRTARQQVTAYENALLKADAEIEALKQDLANTQQALAASREETAAARAEIPPLEAKHAAELAAAADRLTQAEAVIRSREEKIATIESSFSWRVTMPLRALRRRFLDKPVPPSASPALIGNIDYPQDWSNIPPTLNVRGWSLHRDRKPLRAVRARLGNQSVPAEFGLERLDVLDHFRDHPGAERCGWIVKVDVPRYGVHHLVVEAQDEAGAWHVVHSRALRRTEDASPPPPNTYAAWVAAYDSLTPELADQIRTKLAGLTRRPLISVLMPVYNTPEKWLVRAIESVRRQLYDNWELCIADDASKEPHVRRILERYQKKDPRIKVVYRENNGHISAASNSALALAHGEFLALLDHDDEIRPHALACVALELDAHPEADLVYSDEDKIDENGHRYDQYFKPDWNPDLFLVQNYVSHLGVYRTLLVREVGGFRVGYEGSQDWDLAMRVVERTAADRIRHIPKILYHWRSVPGSTAMLIGAKSYATQAAEKVITEHFVRCGINATISPTKGSYWRVHYPLPEPAPKVTLVIPTRNRLNVLKPCVESLLAKTTYPNFEILIVDNDSDDPDTLEYLRTIVENTRVPFVGDAAAPGAGGPAGGPSRSLRVVHFPGDFNFSAINNFGVAQTDAPVVGLLNNDLEVINGDWLEEMVSHALRPEIGCVGAKLYYPDDRIQHAGVILGIGGVAAHAWQTHPRGAAGQAHRNLLQQNLSAVTAACLVIRREVFEHVDGFDEKLRVAFNDVDFCLKVHAAGYRNLWTPYAELYHHESASRGAEDTLEKRDRFRSEVEYITAKWGDTLQHDPAYNPNLTLVVNDFTLAMPPRPWAPLDGSAPNEGQVPPANTGDDSGLTVSKPDLEPTVSSVES